MTALDDALTHARLTTISADEWLRRIRTNPEYAYTRTEWYKALVALELAAKAPPPPPPATGSFLAERIVVFSDVTDHSVQQFALCGPGYIAAFSADLNQSKPGGAYYVSDAQLATARSGGGRLISWSDCSATPFSEATKMRDQRGLDGAMGQCENDGQYDNMTAGGAALGIGNPSNLSQSRRDDATARINAGTLSLTGEMLFSNPGYSGQGVPIRSVTLYTDRDAAQGGYQPLAAFDALGSGYKHNACLYSGGQASDADWDLYRSWTRP